MSSRDLNLLHPELRRRVQLVDRDWRREQPGQPRLIVTSGLRTTEEQARLYAQGRGIPGRIVTRAPAGTSLHEYGLAVDFGFENDTLHEMDWDEQRFKILGVYIIRYGLEWGGGWVHAEQPFRDLPHAQAPGVTWQQAKVGVQPTWTPLPKEVASV